MECGCGSMCGRGKYNFIQIKIISFFGCDSISGLGVWEWVKEATKRWQKILHIEQAIYKKWDTPTQISQHFLPLFSLKLMFFFNNFQECMDAK